MLRTRLDRARARDDGREWVQNRRARTRHLIELGGLVQKAGLVDLIDDDRATLLGALLELAGKLQDHGQLEEGERQYVSPADLKARWRRRGLRAFEADANAAASMSTASNANQGSTAMVGGDQQGGIREDGQPGCISRQIGSAESDR